MLCPVMVGRARERAELCAAGDAARAGAGGWLTVIGEAGVGKTRLVAEAARHCAEQGAIEAWGRCSATDVLTPFRPVAELLMSALRGRDRPSDARMRPYIATVGRFVPHWRTGGQVVLSESPAVIGESVLQVLTWLAGGTGLVAVVEDLQWADAETLAVCEYLADHVAAAPIAILATARTDERLRDAADLAGRTRQVTLTPLTNDQVAEMAAACLGHPPAPALLQSLTSSAGGLPLLIEDLLDPGPDGSPRFGRLVAHRLGQLTAAQQQVVVAAAVLGDQVFGPARLAAVAEIPVPDAKDALVAAAAAHVLTPAGIERYAFRHALTRDAVLAAAPRVRADVAARAAAVLEAEAGEQSLARAAELWSAVGDSDRAARTWARAAAAAAAAGAPGSALAAWRRAVEGTADPVLRSETELGLLAHLASHGPFGEAFELGGRLLDDSEHRPDAARQVRELLARCCLAAGRVGEAERHVTALTAAGPGRGTPIEARILVLRARLALQQGSGQQRVEAEHLAYQAVAQADAAGQAELTCAALDVVARCARGRSLADAQAVLRRSLAVARTSGLTGWQLRILNELGTVEMLASADGARLERARDAALAAGALDLAAAAAVNLASLHAMRGELDAARDMSRQAREDAGRLGITPLVAAALTIEAATAGFLGRKDALEGLLSQAEAAAPDDPDLAAFAWGVGRGLCALIREERAEAIAAFHRARRPEIPIGVLDTARGPLLLTLAAAGTATSGDVVAARATATPGACWSDLWIGYGEAAMAGAAHDQQAASAAFGVAEAAARRYPLFRAIGLRLLAEAALRDRWGEPVAWLRDAEATFVAGRQDRIAAACRGLLNRAGAAVPRRRGDDRGLPSQLLRLGITAREAEVLELVADRLSNKEIAARLFLSPRTVEKHVASLLMKLRAADRAALVARARRP